jgi:hypothetical protein
LFFHTVLFEVTLCLSVSSALISFGFIFGLVRRAHSVSIVITGTRQVVGSLLRLRVEPSRAPVIVARGVGVVTSLESGVVQAWEEHLLGGRRFKARSAATAHSTGWRTSTAAGPGTRDW